MFLPGKFPLKIVIIVRVQSHNGIKNFTHWQVLKSENIFFVGWQNEPLQNDTRKNISHRWLSVHCNNFTIEAVLYFLWNIVYQCMSAWNKIMPRYFSLLLFEVIKLRFNFFNPVYPAKRFKVWATIFLSFQFFVATFCDDK